MRPGSFPPEGFGFSREKNEEPENGEAKAAVAPDSKGDHNYAQSIRDIQLIENVSPDERKTLYEDALSKMEANVHGLLREDYGIGDPVLSSARSRHKALESDRNAYKSNGDWIEQKAYVARLLSYIHFLVRIDACRSGLKDPASNAIVDESGVSDGLPKRIEDLGTQLDKGEYFNSDKALRGAEDDLWV
ncbi:MAG: hypothetical protein V4587_11985 [Acidobacteriota bacterium]